MDKRAVLRETRLDQLFLDNADEVVVQSSINHEDDNFLDAIPNDVDSHVCFIHLQLCGNPDAENGDVDEHDDHGGANLELECSSTVDHQNCNAIDDDLEEKMDLNDPKKKNDDQAS